MFPERRGIQCRNCGHASPADVVREIGLCPRCFAPLFADAPVAPATGREALEAGVSEEQAAVMTGWVDAHNDRDLAGMLARMSSRVAFHPLRLNGVKATYHGHEGVQQWFEQMLADEQEHHLELTELRGAGKDRIVAFGNLRLGRQSDPAPFWALDRFSDGLITEANNYLTDPDILEHGRLFDL